jgi:hypothetical protein
VSARQREDATGSSGDGEILSEGSAIRRSDSGLVIPGPARLPREAAALLARDRSGAQPALRAPEEPQRSAAGDPPSLPPPVARFGKYDVLGRVAVGGMAEIFLAREHLPGGAIRQGALKIIKRGALGEDEARYFEELFLREGRTIVQLAHPHICHVYDIGKEGEHLFIAMEWIDGRSLRDVLARLSHAGELLPPALAVCIRSPGRLGPGARRSTRARARGPSASTWCKTANRESREHHAALRRSAKLVGLPAVAPRQRRGRQP